MWEIAGFRTVEGSGVRGSRFRGLGLEGLISGTCFNIFLRRSEYRQLGCRVFDFVEDLLLKIFIKKKCSIRVSSLRHMDSMV